MTAARKTREDVEARIAERGGKGEGVDAGGPQRRPPNRPWRTEGLPPGGPGGPPKQPSNWWAFVAQAILIYAIAFAVLTMQDRVTGLVTISYSEFVNEVEAGNVAEVFARGESIQGTLKEARPVPGAEQQEATYRRFSTERPVFAKDDLLAKLERSGTAVRATPVVQERGPLTNLLVNEAALLAVRRGRSEVSASDLADALEKVQLGTARNVVIPAEERRRTAYHEAGHALLGMLQPGADPVRKVSIIPRGRALGVTLATPQQDRYGYDAAYLKGRMIGALGGIAAEELVLGVASTGAESDLQTCTAIARSMVGRWGMSERVGPVSVFPPEGDPRMLGVSEGMLDVVAEEVRKLVDECHREATSLLTRNRGRLDAIAKGLLEHETLDEADVYAAAGIAHAAPVAAHAAAPA